MLVRRRAILMGLCLLLSACGQSGDLYLPEPQQPETPERQDR